MLHIVIATRNRHKVRELAALLPIRGIRWHSLAEFPTITTIPERGRTFDANAIQKARLTARATRWLALADDSGLEVSALRWAPGVRSARFAGRHGGDRANNRKLLRLLDRLPSPRRRARYRCSLALASPSGLLALTRGTWWGRIADRPRGTHGFGYDPIFLVPRFDKTVGELSQRIKQRLSHRAQAARRLAPLLQRLARRAQATGRGRGIHGSRSRGAV